MYSKYASDRLNCDVYLKLEVPSIVLETVGMMPTNALSISQNLQNMHSFKYRGISMFAQEALKAHGPSAHLVVASGGD